MKFQSKRSVCSVSDGARPRTTIYFGKEGSKTRLGKFGDVQIAYTVAVLLSSQGGTLNFVSDPSLIPLRRIVERAVEGTGYISHGKLYMVHLISPKMVYNNENMLDVSQTYGPLIRRVDDIGGCRRLSGMQARELPRTGGGRVISV